MADVHRQHDVAVLGDLVGHDGGVEDFLHRLAIHLDPAGLAHHHGVLLPAPDALRAEQIARDERGHHRQAQARRAHIRLEHEGDARPAGRGEGAAAGERHALQPHSTACSPSTFIRLGLEAAVGDHLREVLDQRGLRRDRIDRDHVGPRQADGDRRRLVAFDHDRTRRVGGGTCYGGDRAHRPASSIMLMARCGHSWAQTPQPLQTRKIEVEPARLFDHALHRAIEPAQPALDAFAPVDHRPQAAPVAGQHLAEHGGDRRQVVRDGRGVEMITRLPLHAPTLCRGS